MSLLITALMGLSDIYFDTGAKQKSLQFAELAVEAAPQSRTSNLKLGRVARMEEHPIRALVDAGVTVTVNTDDVLVFGSSLSEEYLALHQAGVLTAAELDAIRLEGLS